MRSWRVAWGGIVASAMALNACSATTRTSPESAFGPVIVDAQRAYLLLADGTVHVSSEGAPTGLFVSGVLEGGRFVPDGDVQGEGTLAAPGIEGWLELLDGSFYSARSGRAPLRPYIAGTMGRDGSFSPSSRKVAY